MTAARSGHHVISVRLEDHIITALKEKAAAQFPTQAGRGGGVSHLLRVLAYRELGLPAPEPHASHISPRKLRKQRPAE